MTTVDDTAPRTTAPTGRTRSPGALARRRFLRNKLALAGLAFLVLMVAAALFAPLISAYPPNQIDLGAVRQPPSSAHWLGTDSTGRDVLSRILHAGRVSLMIGFLTAVIAVTAGTLLGATAGWFGGWFDAVVTRVVDLLLSVPPVLVVIVLAGILGPDVTLLVLVIAGLSWPTSCRIARGVVLSLREQEYVQAARAVGSRPKFIVMRHLVPPVMPAVTVAATLLVAEAILLEAALSFLGIGVRPPQASWGNMLTEAQSLTVLSGMPWLWLPTGLAIALTVLAVTFVGDGLRDAVDPRQT